MYNEYNDVQTVIVIVPLEKLDQRKKVSAF